MSMQWLSVRSFQQSQQVLAAVNALSIHLKLSLAGMEDEAHATDASRSREILSPFLDDLDGILKAMGESGNRALTGADARTRQLARSFWQARRERSAYRSLLFRSSPAEVKRLLISSRAEDRKALVECLSDLRKLLEAHIHTDSQHILGEV